MSILLIGAGSALGETLVRRLVGEGDEVRVLILDTEDVEEGGRLADLGAYIATGPELDADLVERAATNCRTIVVIERSGDDTVEIVRTAITGGRSALGTPDEGMRLILCGAPPDEDAVQALRESGIGYVTLRTGRKLAGFLPIASARLTDDQVAIAVDAADDIAGEVKLELDLTEEADWKKLKLEPPGQTPR